MEPGLSALSACIKIMIKLYFGLPGSGKTTLLVSEAIKATKDIRYESVFSNVHMNVDGVTYIENDEIGIYNTYKSLILIDEATLFADSRDHKNFPKHLISFFLLHRHYQCDVILFTQQWDAVDKKIRVITDRVYYVYKPLLFGHWFTKYYRIPYGIIIPDPKKDDSTKLGEIVQGYCKPSFFKRLFSPWLFRPRYYKYFDSWEAPPLPELPNKEERTYRKPPKEKKKKPEARKSPGPDKTEIKDNCQDYQSELEQAHNDV